MDTSTSYRKVSSYEAKKGEFDRCLLLYSGGLDTSVILKWIQDQYESKVVALTINLGQTKDNLEAIKQKAIKLGAEDCIVYDARKRFADELVSEAIMANADYQGGYALGCPLGRVMIAQIAVEEAKKHNCQVIAHGATGKGNDQVRFESYILTLSPGTKVIAPVREWGMGRTEEIEYANKHGIPIAQKKETPYSADENMWAITSEGGEIENPAEIPKMPQILQWCNTLDKTPDAMETLVIEYEKGLPVSLNGKKMELMNIVKECNTIGAKHGVGTTVLIEDRLLGLKVRGVYEQPAARILIDAHKRLELLVSTRRENEFKPIIDQKWAYLTYAAQWFNPVMDHLRAYIKSQNEKVTGKVTVQVFKGTVHIMSVDSPNSLFDMNLATFDRNATFNQNSSPGFIEIYNLSQRCAYGAKQQHSKKTAKRVGAPEAKNGNPAKKARTEALSAPEAVSAPSFNNGNLSDEELKKRWLHYQEKFHIGGGLHDIRDDFNRQQDRFTHIAEIYDRAVALTNYTGASKLAEKINALFPNKNIKILDYGCGTGLVADNLSKFGFNDIDGLDPSKASLDVARKKNIMKKLYNLQSNESHAEITDTYDLIVSSGVFFISKSYPGYKCVGDLCRLVKKGGHIVILTKNSHLERDFVDHSVITDLENKGTLKIYPKELYPGYRQKLAFEDDVIAAILRYEVL